MNDQFTDNPSKNGTIAREAAAPMVLQLGPTEQNSSQGFSLNVVWRRFLQRLALGLTLGVVLSLLALAAILFFSEQKFKSIAQLQIVEKQHIIAFQLHEVSTDFAQTQIELIKGPYIIGRAMEAEGLGQLPELLEIKGKEDAVLWIGKNLKANRVGRAEIYEISFTTKSKESARKVVEAVVNTYMQFQSSDADTRRQRMLEVLDEELRLYDSKIELARAKLRELAKSAGGDDGVLTMPGGKGGGTQQVKLVSQTGNLQQKLVDAEVEVEVAKARFRALMEEAQRAEAEPDASGTTPASQQLFVPESQIEARLDKDPDIIGKVNDLKKKQDRLRKLAKESSQYAQTEQDIAKIKGDLEAKKAELKPGILAEALQQRASQRRDELAAAKAELDRREQTKELLRVRAQAERGSQTQHGDKSLELQFARDELTKVEEIRALIADRSVHLQTESRAPEQVRMIQKATLPEFADGPTTGKKLLVAGGAAFFAPSLMLVGWSLVRRRIFQREQLEGEFNIKFVSEVAALPSRSMIRKPGSDRAYQLQLHLFQESINALRVTLATDERLKDTQVYMIASAVSGEGKSNLSAQMAMSWSQSGQGQVVLIDADLRKPSVHRLFDVRRDPGLAEVLRGECTLDDALVMDWSDRLFVLPAGAMLGKSPSNLFSGNHFREVLATLRQRFDKIIIDVPPVLCASETLLIAKAADAVLLCARHDFSNAGQIKHAYDRLTGAGANIAGAVLNGTPVHKYSYSYRGYAPV